MDMLYLITAGITLGSLIGPIAAAIVAIFNGAVLSFWNFLTGLVVVRKYVNNGREEVIEHLFTGGGLRNLGVDLYWIQRIFVRPMADQMSVWFRNTSFSWRIAFWRGWPILVTPGDPSIFTFFRWSVKFEEILKEVADIHHARSRDTETTQKRFRLVRITAEGQAKDGNEMKAKPTQSIGAGVEPLGWRADELGVSAEGATVADLAMTPSMQRIAQDARFWHAHREWYRQRGIPWRRGYMLYGDPGGGKTSLARALAEELDMPVYQFDLSGMSNNYFLQQWNSLRQGGSRIVLFEDFDSVFKGRENVSKGDGDSKGFLTFDTVLNTLDGIEREDGLLLIVTTNHIEHIDPALGAPAGGGRSTRPGRIDLVVQFEPLGHAGRVKIAQRIMLDPEAAERMATEGLADSPAQLVERCIQAASADLWSKFDDTQDIHTKPHSDEGRGAVDNKIGDIARRLGELMKGNVYVGPTSTIIKSPIDHPPSEEDDPSEYAPPGGGV